MCCFCEIFIILDFIDLLKLSVTAPFITILWVVWKFNPWRFRFCLTVELSNSEPLFYCMVIGFLFRNKFLQIWYDWFTGIFFYSHAPSTPREKFLWFEGVFWLVVFDGELKSARSISHISSIFLQHNDCAVISFLHVCANCTCSAMTAINQHPVSYIYLLLLTLFWHENCWMFMTVIDPYPYTLLIIQNSQGTSFVFVICVYLSPLFCLFLTEGL